MELFDNDQHVNLAHYKSYELKLSPIYISTLTAYVHITNLNYNEEELAPIWEFTDNNNIATIDSNYIHLVNPNAKLPYTKPKAKKTKKNRKQRRIQGDGSSFNSQTSIGVIGTWRRPITIPDKHSLRAVKYADNTEEIRKVYIFKVFRNGKIIVSGVLDEYLRDIAGPLEELRVYLVFIMSKKLKMSIDIQIFSQNSVMKNYKLILLSGVIDIDKLIRLCNDHFQNLLNTNIYDIYDVITSPSFIGINSYSWRSLSNDIYKGDISKHLEIDMVDTLARLKTNNNICNIRCKFSKLRKYITDVISDKLYKKIIVYINILTYLCIKPPNNTFWKLVLKFSLHKYIKELNNMLTSSKHNNLSYYKYRPDKYQGFIIKVKTPTPDDDDKETTVKIFPDGKINIDGANNREETEFIYYWLNSIFVDNDIIRQNNIKYYEFDSEFSD